MTAENAQERRAFVANRYWIVRGIGRLIENGTKSDEHAFPETHLDQAEKVLLKILEKEKGEEFNLESDAVSVAINSPRGRCIEALITLSLRSCRLADKQHGDHAETWFHFEPVYDSELARAKTGEYEFSTLLGHYLIGFLYMSPKWVLANLSNIFNQNNYQQWTCVMQGYSYVNTIYDNIYQYLKENGDFIKALDDDNIKKKVKERVVENIAVAFINDFEKLDDESSLINQLVVRNKYSELSQLVWFFWTLRTDENKDIKIKALQLWPRILEVINPDTAESRKLASALCNWTVFIDEINDINKPLILAVAPYANEDYHTYDLLENIARISLKQPFEAYEIWCRLLEASQPDYPKEAIQEALANLVKNGADGVIKAKDIVSKYLRAGNEEPHKILKEIVG